MRKAPFGTVDPCLRRGDILSAAGLTMCSLISCGTPALGCAGNQLLLANTHSRGRLYRISPTRLSKSDSASILAGWVLHSISILTILPRDFADRNECQAPRDEEPVRRRKVKYIRKQGPII